MLVRQSSFLHRLPLSGERSLLIHAISHLRLVVDKDVASLVEFFGAGRQWPDEMPILKNLLDADDHVIIGCVTALLERGVLIEKDAAAELESIKDELDLSHGRDPAALVDRFRRMAREGAEPYWSTGSARHLVDIGKCVRRVDVILIGECDVHMESDFLRREAAQRGIDLRVAAAFAEDVRFASEHKHDAIVIGALQARNAVVHDSGLDPPVQQHGVYVAEAARLLRALRTQTSAPILIDNLAEPTVEPLGMAERGMNGHRNRVRLANLSLSQFVEGFSDVHIVDVAAALAAVGAERMLDDGQVSFTHFGSPGWMLQRPDSERAAVHDLFPDMAPLARLVNGDPYGRETVMAKAHLDALTVVLGLDRKKCVIVDLDGVLWPGVLAETGAPFAWSPEISGPFSYIGLYFGLHEALLSLKRRGLLLAYVSKNDEATVRELWTYADHYPGERLLHPEDFVACRVNWADKVDNICSIADELDFALETFLFIDDHPIERDLVRQRLPEVEVWGEDLFGLRRALRTRSRRSSRASERNHRR